MSSWDDAAGPGTNAQLWFLSGLNVADVFDVNVYVSKTPNRPMSAGFISWGSNPTPGSFHSHGSLTDRNTANIRAWAIGSTVAGRILAGSKVTAWRRRRG